VDIKADSGKLRRHFPCFFLRPLKINDNHCYYLLLEASFNFKFSHVI